MFSSDISCVKDELYFKQASSEAQRKKFLNRYSWHSSRKCSIYYSKTKFYSLIQSFDILICRSHWFGKSFLIVSAFDELYSQGRMLWSSTVYKECCRRKVLCNSIGIETSENLGVGVGVVGGVNVSKRHTDIHTLFFTRKKIKDSTLNLFCITRASWINAHETSFARRPYTYDSSLNEAKLANYH
jgi:hypothetical protein